MAPKLLSIGRYIYMYVGGWCTEWTPTGGAREGRKERVHSPQARSLVLLVFGTPVQIRAMSCLLSSFTATKCLRCPLIGKKVDYNIITNWIKKSKIGKLVFIDCSLGRMELKEKSDTDETS